MLPICFYALPLIFLRLLTIIYSTISTSYNTINYLQRGGNEGSIPIPKFQGNYYVSTKYVLLSKGDFFQYKLLAKYENLES